MFQLFFMILLLNISDFMLLLPEDDLFSIQLPNPGAYE